MTWKVIKMLVWGVACAEREKEDHIRRIFKKRERQENKEFQGLSQSDLHK
jgi:hypothetical protein